MRIDLLQSAPAPQLAAALERFEEQFTYPLGPGRSFRISHGADYPRFFRAMGDGACFVASKNDKVVGVLGVALRTLQLPSGDCCPAVYFGDLKIDPAARGSRMLLYFAAAVREWVGTRARVGYGVVMDGTPVSPGGYTGRLGIPNFEELGKIAVLRLTSALVTYDPGLNATEEQGYAAYARLSVGRYAGPGGQPVERSEIVPSWLVTADGDACGRLEDTRRAKKLIADDGQEMLSGHLSCFAYADAQAGAGLLKLALHRAARAGLPALFTAVPASEASALRATLPETTCVLAPATVYGVGLATGPLWNVNTAEI